MITGAQREEIWRRYKAGETILGIGPPKIEATDPSILSCD
jgi:hypothetical protein